MPLEMVGFTHPRERPILHGAIPVAGMVAPVLFSARDVGTNFAMIIAPYRAWEMTRVAVAIGQRVAIEVRMLGKAALPNHTPI
ncbi:MAG: hypothetical protein QXZ09_09195 [Candidatus Methanomethylicaceae archaeon]